MSLRSRDLSSAWSGVIPKLMNDKEKAIAREMMPFFIHIIWPILIIIMIAKTYAPDTY